MIVTIYDKDDNELWTSEIPAATAHPIPAIIGMAERDGVKVAAMSIVAIEYSMDEGEMEEVDDEIPEVDEDGEPVMDYSAMRSRPNPCGWRRGRG